jgi:non-ribosomal peptide synthetase component F
VLQAAWAQLLMGLTGQHDVVFGAVVSGRPAEVPGADSMVGLLINTVPVRATVGAATTTIDLLDQLQNGYTGTLEHQHLALSEIHRIAGQPRLFDTVFVYENYPTDAAGLTGADGLAITDIATRDFYHYPLTVQAVPGRELDLRVQFRADVFDATEIEALIERLNLILIAMITDPTQPLSPTQVLGRGTRAVPVGSVSTPEHHAAVGTHRAPANAVEQTIADVYAHVLEIDHVGVEESFFDIGGDSLSAMRAIAEINTALGSHLALSDLLGAPSVVSLSRRLGGDR